MRRRSRSRSGEPIVDAHGGDIGIEDSPLGGARVAIVLPRTDAVIDEAHRILARAGA